MQTFLHYSDIPTSAKYLGSGDPMDGMTEELCAIVDQAVEPARLREDDGSFSYFELQPYR